MFMNSNSDDQTEDAGEIEKIYIDAIAKLGKLKAAQKKILDTAKRRQEAEQINKIRKNLN